MQEVSVGIQRLHYPLLAAKENCLAGPGVKTRALPAQSDDLTRTVAVPAAGDDLMDVDVSSPAKPRGSPLPQLAWANSGELWVHMRAKDVSKTAPEQELQLLHPGILPSMRTILLDWLMEVCVMCNV